MRMYAHDYVWDVQHRKAIPGTACGFLDFYDWMSRNARWIKRSLHQI